MTPKFAVTNPSSSSGFAAISTVLILTVVVLSISTVVSLTSIGEGQSSLSMFKGEDALAFVEGCAEDALIKIRNDLNYNGGNISHPEGNCQISVISKAGAAWVVDVSTTNIKYRRTIRLNLVRNPSAVTLTNWKEI